MCVVATVMIRCCYCSWPGVLRCTDTGENVLVSTMVDVPGLVLYAVEIVDGEALLLFMQVGAYL